MGHGSNNQNPRWAQLSVFLFYTGNSALSKALSEKPQSLVICPPEVETGTFYPNRKRFVTARGQRMLFSQALFINHLFCGAARGSKAKCPPLFFPGQMSQEILVGPPFLPPSSAGMSWGGGLKKLSGWASFSLQKSFQQPIARTHQNKFKNILLDFCFDKI